MRGRSSADRSQLQTGCSGNYQRLPPGPGRDAGHGRDAELHATSVDRSVLDTLDYVREITALTRDHIPGRVPARDDDGRLLTDAGGKPVMRQRDVSFASEDSRRAIRDRQRPGMFVRRRSEGVRADLPGRGTAHRRRRGGQGASVRELGRPSAQPGAAPAPARTTSPRFTKTLQ